MHKSKVNRFDRPARKRTSASNRRTKKEKQPANNQSMSHSAQFRCEKCGLQLFLTQPFSFHRQSNKLWCLQCHDQLKQDEILAQKESEKQQINLPKSMRHEASEVPSMADFLRPILKWASEQPGEFTLREATGAMASHFKLSTKAKDEMTEEGNVDRVYDRTSWSINPHLKEAGLVHSIRRGYWKITEAGKKEAFASNKRMTTNYLTDNFPSYRHWKENKKNNKE